MSKKYIVFSATVALITPFLAFAQDKIIETNTYIYDFYHIPSWLERTGHFVVFFVALSAAVYAVKLAALAQGGSMEKIWNRLAIVAGIFALITINEVIEDLGLARLELVYMIFEFLIGITLLSTFIKMRSDLMKQTFGK